MVAAAMRFDSVVRRRTLGVLVGAGLVVGDVQPGIAAAAAVDDDGAGSPPRVAVVRTADGDAPLDEIATRIIAELMANGITVVALGCVAAEPACLATAGDELLATVVVTRGSGRPAVVVHSGDDSAEAAGAGARPGGAPRVRRLAAAGGGKGPLPAALAVRTVELVRALRVEAVDREAEPVVIPVADTEEPEEMEAFTSVSAAAPARGPSTPGPPRPLALSLGVVMIGNFNGLGMAFGPALRASRRASEHVAVSLDLVGPAYGRDIGMELGWVSVRQEMALARLDFVSRLGSLIVGWAGAGGGIYHIQVDGHVAPVSSGGLQAASVGAFSTTLVWSAGLVGNVVPGVGVFLDAHLILRTPTQIIRVAGTDVGQTGNPGMMVAGGVELRI
jgi:hypothetical protein